MNQKQLKSFETYTIHRIVRYVNENKIKKKDIQSIIPTSLRSVALLYWEIKR